MRRVVTFEPYMRGKGPTFRLGVEDTGIRGDYGKKVVAFDLVMIENGTETVLFEGDGADSGLHTHAAPLSNEAIESVMGFLTLRPGDTDDEYFAKYTPAQREYAEAHAEMLSCEVQAMFCDENGNVIDRENES